MKTRKMFHFNFTSCLENARRSRVWAMLCLAVCMLGLGVSATADDHKPPIITINAPGAGTAAGLGTQPMDIDPAGVVIGFYSDSNNVMHGFLRAPDGRITTFDAPGAGSETVTGVVPTPVAMGGQGTYPIAINPEGEIAGLYVDGSSVLHGFLRSRDGKFTTFDAPGAGTGFGQGTNAGNINPRGVAAGNYLDASYVWHGFLRFPGGRIATFDAPGAGTGAGQGTETGWATSMNSSGAVAGSYVDAQSVVHGYVRAPDGTITEFDVSGAGTSAWQGTYAWSINHAGAVLGAYIDADWVYHGYVRAPDGTITKFDVPAAGTGAGQGTVPECMNSAGVIIGNYLDTSGVNHGFVRTPDGEFTYFDVPGAGTGAGQGTIPYMNDLAAEIGVYIDDGGVIHGFLRTTKHEEDRGH